MTLICVLAIILVVAFVSLMVVFVVNPWEPSSFLVELQLDEQQLVRFGEYFCEFLDYMTLWVQIMVSADTTVSLTTNSSMTVYRFSSKPTRNGTCQLSTYDFSYSLRESWYDYSLLSLAFAFLFLLLGSTI